MDSILDRRKRKNLLIEEENISKEKIIKNYGRMVNLSEKLIGDIEYNDKTYINRIYKEEEELDITELKESIRKIGLINLVYLIKNINNKLTIVSGLRRLTACKELYLENEEVKGKERVIIFEKDTPIEYLEHISLDENTKRKDLKIIELSYKLNKEAQKDNVTIENIMERYNIGRRHFFRIKGAINYPDELKDRLENLGIAKAELINNIINLSEDQTVKEVIKKYENYTKEDLQKVLTELKKGIENKKIDYSVNGNKINIKIRKKLPKEVKKYLFELLENIKNDDFSFIK